MSDDFIEYETMFEYKMHYENHYCRTPIITFDGIRVFFDKNRFEHAFFESSNRDGNKDLFSEERALRIDWIKKTLLSNEALLYKGWNKKDKLYNSDERVAVVIDNFVVVIRLSLNRKGVLKGKFITCYEATNSILKIKTSPQWDKNQCMKVLNK